jgi:hypothetical protein
VNLLKLFKLLHLFFAFSFVGALVVAEWNSRAARRTSDWSQRAALWGAIRLSGVAAGLAGLVLSGVFGNLSAVQAHFDMRSSTWLHTVNGLWVVTLLLYAGVCTPATARLAHLSVAAAIGGPSEGYDTTLGRWRLANAAVTLLYLVMLTLMVLRWGP